MKIYLQTCQEWKELYDLGRRRFGCFVGYTSQDDVELRFANRDYSHFISKPHVYKVFDVHPELTDHFIHSELEHVGFQKYNKVSEQGRSPDFLVSDYDENEALDTLKQIYNMLKPIAEPEDEEPEMDMDDGEADDEEDEGEEMDEAVGYPNYRADQVSKVKADATDVNQGLNESFDGAARFKKLANIKG